MLDECIFFSNLLSVSHMLIFIIIAYSVILLTQNIYNMYFFLLDSHEIKWRQMEALEPNADVVLWEKDHSKFQLCLNNVSNYALISQHIKFCFQLFSINSNVSHQFLLKPICSILYNANFYHVHLFVLMHIMRNIWDKLDTLCIWNKTNTHFSISLLCL